MNILIAPNSMKGSLNAFEFANIVEKAFVSYSTEFNIRKIPVADGGDFTGEILSQSLNAKIKYVVVIGPLGDSIQSKYAISGKTAIIEMADASGMKLIPSELLNPLNASSFGTGQLIFNAIENGCNHILLAIGGSATVDGGMGMMEALGFRFFDKTDNLLQGNGENLAKIIRIQNPKKYENIEIEIICDVDNPLLGEKGAAAVFGPQKGANPKMVVDLEIGLKNLDELIKNETGDSFAEKPGVGAAGGLSILLLAFMNAKIVSGANFVLDKLNFNEHVKWADFVITGEGKIDSQTLNNKAPFAVAQRARLYKKPVYAICGKVENEGNSVFDKIYSFMNGQVSLEYSLQNAERLLFDYSTELAKMIYSMHIKNNV